MPEFGHITVINGMRIQTRFPWAMFTTEWRRGIVNYVRQVYQKEAAAGRAVRLVAIDHINVAEKTFQSRIEVALCPK